MKTTGIGAVALATALCLSANAGERQWYVAVEGGVSWTDASVSGAALPLCGLLGLTDCRPDSTTDSGWAVFGVVGTEIVKNIRLEGEIGYRSGGLGNKGDITNTSLMLNGIFDIPVTESLKLSVGAGAGFDWVATERNVSAPAFTASDSSSGFAYQALAGLSYGLSDNVDLTVAYRYLNTPGTDELYADVRMYGAASDTAVARVDQTSASTVTVGLRFAL